MYLTVESDAAAAALVARVANDCDHVRHCEDVLQRLEAVLEGHERQEQAGGRRGDRHKRAVAALRAVCVKRGAPRRDGVGGRVQWRPPCGRTAIDGHHGRVARTGEGAGLRRDACAHAAVKGGGGVRRQSA